jgi:hypothetical protein
LLNAVRRQNEHLTPAFGRPSPRRGEGDAGRAGGCGEVSMEDRSIDNGSVGDPLFAVWARKALG